MNLHEYQAKQLLSRAGLGIPQGSLCRSLEEVDAWLECPNRHFVRATWVAKCQIHAGGRGGVGGVVTLHDTNDLRVFATRWLGQRLSTPQTSPEGLSVDAILIEAEEHIKTSFYLSVCFDRNIPALVVIASPHGGVDIEEKTQSDKTSYTTLKINSISGPTLEQGYELARRLGIHQEKMVLQFTDVFMKLATWAWRNDVTLAEINPLVYTLSNQFVCLDAKITLDDNALYRHPEWQQLRDPNQEDPREYAASQSGFSYVSLGGNIGCMVNGAGLAMATMDTISAYGGKPANFLDIGGGTTARRVTEAIKLIVSDPYVEGIVINIFGGIVRCDMIAEGLIDAFSSLKLTLPIVIRLEGNNADHAKKTLLKSQLKVLLADDVDDAAQKIISIVNTPSYEAVREVELCPF